MADMTRHDIYGHEVSSIRYHLNQIEQSDATLEIRRILNHVEESDAGPLPRGTEFNREEITNAVYNSLRVALGDPHVEVKKLDKGMIQVFVRLTKGGLDSFVIKITRQMT
jgi:hypothetical protein